MQAEDDELPARRKAGRPPFVPTDEQRELVKDLATAGTPQEQIALMVKDAKGSPISHVTLRKHFRPELDEGTIEANAKMAGRLFKEGMSGNVAAMIFWLKTRARWSEQPQKVELTGADGKPLPSAPPALLVQFDEAPAQDGEGNTPP